MSMVAILALPLQITQSELADTYHNSMKLYMCTVCAYRLTLVSKISPK